MHLTWRLKGRFQSAEKGRVGCQWCVRQVIRHAVTVPLNTWVSVETCCAAWMGLVRNGQMCFVFRWLIPSLPRSVFPVNANSVPLFGCTPPHPSFLNLFFLSFHLYRSTFLPSLHPPFLSFSSSLKHRSPRGICMATVFFLSSSCLLLWLAAHIHCVFLQEKTTTTTTNRKKNRQTEGQAKKQTKVNTSWRHKLTTSRIFICYV